MARVTALQSDLRRHIDENYVTRAATFFKTGPGEYAEGEQFLGIRKPAIRKLAKQYVALDYPAIDNLLDSVWHEEKMAAVLILLGKYQQSDNPKLAYQYYADNRTRINNWDLVDDTAAHIVGHYHYHHKVAYPRAWVKESSLWARRIAIVATHYYIKQKRFNETLRMVKQVLSDKEDLIHKAAGWMLREIGKQDRAVLVDFLDHTAHELPRTMLRYAIEHFSPKERQSFMQQKAS